MTATMRRTLILFVVSAALAAFAATSALAQNADRLRVAPGPVAVRENPSNGSPKVMSLKAGQRVRIDYEADGWVAVFPPEQKNRAESSALGYVRLNDLRLAGPLDLRRDGASAEKEKDRGEAKAAPGERKKADKPKTAAEKKREAKEARAAAEKAKREGKALKTSPKGALTRDELLATPQQKATVRTASVVVEKSAERTAEQKVQDAQPAGASQADAKSAEAAALLADQKAAQAPARPAPPKPAPPKPAPPKEEDFGVIRVPDRPLAVRAARNKDSEFKKLLQPGQRVRTDMQADGFYAVFAPDERVKDIKRAWGYGRDKYLLTEKEFAVRGAAYPPTNSTDRPAPAPQPEPKPEPKAELKPELKAEARPAPVEPRKPTPQPEQKNATAAPVPAQPAAPAAPKPAPLPAPVQERKPAPADQAQANGSAAQAAAPAAGEEVLGYALLERREDPLRPLAPVLLRVRLETPYAPAQETLRRVAREIWKAERRKADEVVLELYLAGMDPASLAYAVVRFAPDGRIRELYWRDALVPKKR